MRMYSAVAGLAKDFMQANAGINARKCAVKILSDVLDRAQSLDDAWGAHAPLRALEERDRHFARLLVMTALRRLGQCDALLAQMLQKPLQGKSNTVMHCLRLGVVQLIWLETPAHAAVHAMVEVTAALGLVPMKGLVNAVLKRVAKEGSAIIAMQDEAQLNVPQWLYQSWVDAYGADTAKMIAQSRLVEPPLDITVKEDAAGWAEKLGGTLLPTGSVRLMQAGRVEALEGFEQGAWWVQDAGAALPALMLGDVRGQTVLDVCAAPGGKAAQLAVRGANVIALDKSAKRLERLTANMQRLGLKVQAVEADALKWQPQTPVDAVLLDAPCSATGTLRRHPEVVWHRTKQDIDRLADLQRQLLARAASWVKPLGKLVYCVCSLQPEEGERQIKAFFASHPQFVSVPPAIAGMPPSMAQNGALRTHPGFAQEPWKMDGFYANCMQRIK